MAEVYLSIGSNIEPAKHIRAALTALQARYGEVLLSPVYETEAVGFAGDNFYNLVASLTTEESPQQVAQVLREIEDAQGRKRTGERFSSRTLDIDLLLYDDWILHTDQLEIPRNEIVKYAFVLRPLAELSPNAVHPITGQTYAALWAAFPETPETQAMRLVSLPA